MSKPFKDNTKYQALVEKLFREGRSILSISKECRISRRQVKNIIYDLKNSSENKIKLPSRPDYKVKIQTKTKEVKTKTKTKTKAIQKQIMVKQVIQKIQNPGISKEQATDLLEHLKSAVLKLENNAIFGEETVKEMKEIQLETKQMYEKIKNDFISLKINHGAYSSLGILVLKYKQFLLDITSKIHRTRIEDSSTKTIAQATMVMSKLQLLPSTKIEKKINESSLASKEIANSIKSLVYGETKKEKSLLVNS